MAGRSTRTGSSLRSRVGDPPTDDSLATVGWMVRTLGELAAEVLTEPGLSRPKRRKELLAIAGAMAKLRDQDRIGRAERALSEADQQQADRPGPELVARAAVDASSARPVAARRGKPRRGTLR